MDTIGELELLIRQLGNEKRQPEICAKAREFLNSVEPAALREAERRLLERGLPVERLNQLCNIHMDLFYEESNLTQYTGSDGTSYIIIDELYREHEVMLDLIEGLEGIGHRLQSFETFDFGSHEVTRLTNLVDSLMNFESHPRREDEVVFPELERMKAKCSSKVLAAEHRRLHDELANLSELVHTTTTDMKRFRQKAAANINVLVPMWWRHIFKENNIILPSFGEYVTDQHRLIELKTLCDNIGYAGFETIMAVRK